VLLLLVLILILLLLLLLLINVIAVILVQVFIGWSLWMGFIYMLWRRTALLAIGGASAEAQEVASVLTFPIQLFDDLFTEIIFLSVDPFSAVFFGMLIFYFVRDVVRDAGYGWLVLDWIRGKHEIDLRSRCRALLLRYHLCEQNLFSELLAAVVVPLAVACDLVFSALGFGANTITAGLNASEQIALLQMYGVLLSVELLTHAVVRRLMNRQLFALRAIVQTQPHTQENNKFVSTGNTGKRRMSIMLVTSGGWNRHEHNKRYWNTHFSYFMCMVTFVVITVLFNTGVIKHRLSESV